MKRRKRRLVFILAAVTAAAALLYALDAARQVTARMGGKTFKLPSRIFGAPVTFYPDAPLGSKDLLSHLRELAYQETKRRPVETGQWFRDGNRFEIGVRAFQDASGPHEASRIGVEIDNDHVEALFRIDHEPAEGIFTASLEPKMIGEFFASKREERTIVRLQETPEMLREAVLLMEDRNFYSHHGLSFRGVLRALWANLRGRKVTQGGSTLTQQLMKNFFLTPERTLSRKVREAIMTLAAEALYSKDQIFEAYLNEIYLGQRGSASVHGFGEASKFYFSKPLQSATLGEQALLVGLISSPGLYSPYNSIAGAKARRQLVLKILRDEEKISQKDFEAAGREPVSPRGRIVGERFAPYFVDYVRKEMEARYSETTLAEEGFEIHTTLDPFLQTAAQQAVNDGMPELEKRVRAARKGADEKTLQVALLAVQPQTGAVKAMIGGRNYAQSQFNRVTSAKRQPGSSMKPFVAAAALTRWEEGGAPAATAATLLEDSPATFVFSGQEWSPKNYDDLYFGTVTARQAIERSLNAATINLAAKTGIDKVVSVYEKFGFEHVSQVPSAVLGSLEVTPFDLTRAYTVFPNGGLKSELQGITSVIDPGGHRLEQHSLKVERVMPEESAFLVTNILEGVIERGTAASAHRLARPGTLAGKTGTTDGNRDTWFVGYGPSLLVTVWVGYDDGTETGLTGASAALQIWIRFMRQALGRFPDEKFAVPKNISWVEIDRARGCAGGKGEKWREAFLPGTEPPPCK